LIALLASEFRDFQIVYNRTDVKMACIDFFLTAVKKVPRDFTANLKSAPKCSRSWEKSQAVEAVSLCKIELFLDTHPSQFF
jgi:hypothetical protein